MVAPKRLITLDARTDAIADRIKRGSTYGLSHWVRCRLLEAANAEAPAYLPSPIVARQELLEELKYAKWKARIWSNAVRLLIERHEPDALNHAHGVDALVFEAYSTARKYLLEHGALEGDE